MNKKTKIALCLSGEPRSSMFCFPYIYESFINLGPEYEVDVYIHSWKNFRALKLYNPKEYSIDWINEELTFLEIWEELKTKKLGSNVSEILNEATKYTYNQNAIKNYFLMYMSMQKCFNLIKTPYDIYIRGRFDFYFPFPLNLIPILKEFKTNKYDISLPLIERTLVPSPGLTKNFHIYSDQLSICNPKAAKYYFNMSQNIFDLIKTTDSIDSHDWLKSYINNSELNINTHSFPIDLVRSSRIITQQNEPYFDN
tara:strand:+ start:10026 stop:10787 length:762 start_codon:yes stop_codon:yes gene_type:complete